MRDHPTNPYGVLIPCANQCGHEIHVPRGDLAHGVEPENVTCSHQCMTERRDRIAAVVSLDADPMQRLRAAGYREAAPA